MPVNLTPISIGSTDWGATVNSYWDTITDAFNGTETIGPLNLQDGAGKYLRLPKLTTAERDALTAADGMMLFNTTTSRFEQYQNGAWGAFVFNSGVDNNFTVDQTMVGIKGTAGASGSALSVTGGAGSAGNGGASSLIGGAGGGASGNGGTALVDGGSGSGSGTNGLVQIGPTNASSIEIGRTGVNTLLKGTNQITANGTVLTISSIVDGEYLYRSGSTIISQSASGGGGFSEALGYMGL